MGPLAVPFILWARADEDDRDDRPDRTPTPRSKEPPSWLNLSSLRDPILFFGGLAGIVHQTVIADVVQWELLLVFMAMLGLPFPLRADDRRRNGDG